MQINVRSLTGKAKQYDFEPDTQIIEVKKAIHEKESVSPEQLKLVFNGKQLTDSDTLSHYNIKAGDTLHYTVFLRGG